MKLVQNGSIMSPAMTARHFTVIRAMAYAQGRERSTQISVVRADIQIVRHTMAG
jgi:hypothetical protein